MVSVKWTPSCLNGPSWSLKVSEKHSSNPNRSNEDKQASDFEHWQLNEMESLSAFNLDYRVSKTLQDKCSAVLDVKAYLEKAYTGHIAVEFEHIQNEDERLWLYENYEQIIHEPVNNGEKVKAL